MKISRTLFRDAMMVTFVTIGLSSAASAGEPERQLARVIADYLIAGRTVIAVNQPIINNPAKGQARFSPSVYETMVHYEFLRMTGTDLSEIKTSDTDYTSSSLRTLHESAMDVIDRFQTRINRPGQGFKGVNPAMFGVWVGQEFNKRSGIGLKQTSTKYRATYNQPDAFETEVLRKFEDSRSQAPYFRETTEDGKSFARYMVPLYISKECLGCHGEPAGELDVTNRAKEGYKEGDLRGAISVVVPVP